MFSVTTLVDYICILYLTYMHNIFNIVHLQDVTRLFISLKIGRKV